MLDVLTEVQSVGTIEAEIYILEDELTYTERQIHLYDETIRHIEGLAARKGGKPYLEPEDMHKLKEAQSESDVLRSKQVDIKQKLSDKQRRELPRAREVANLREQLDHAIDLGQADRAYAIASRFKTLVPSLEEAIDSELVRSYWRIAINSNAGSYPERKRAWEKVEALCYKVGDNDGLHGACDELADLYEQWAEDDTVNGDFATAAEHYREAYEKYSHNNAQYEQQRVLCKLVRISRRLGQTVEALRYSSERIKLLQYLSMLAEAQRCYAEALAICVELPDETKRIKWEHTLTSLVLPESIESIIVT